jgi:threonine/homoserine/homoserine lactone efflux protein
MILELIGTGVLLGLAAGMSPGPLLALVLSETIRGGLSAGLKVAVAPLITDIPIVTGAILLMSWLSSFQPILGVISLVGGAFVLYLGVEGLRTRAPGEDESPLERRSLLRGVLTNALSPHPYLFWMAVGAPTVVRAYDGGGVAAASGFIASFYLLLIGSKVLLAVIAAGSRRALTSSSAYIWVNRTLGAAMCLFAVLLFREGALLLSLIPG